MTKLPPAASKYNEILSRAKDYVHSQRGTPRATPTPDRFDGLNISAKTQTLLKESQQKLKQVMKQSGGKSDAVNEVFYRMMVDYYEGLARIERETSRKEGIISPASMTAKLAEGQEQSLGRKLTIKE